MMDAKAASAIEALQWIADTAQSLGTAAGFNVARQAHMDTARIAGLVTTRRAVSVTMLDVSDTPAPDERRRHPDESSHGL